MFEIKEQTVKLDHPLLVWTNMDQIFNPNSLFVSSLYDSFLDLYLSYEQQWPQVKNAGDNH